MWAISNKQFDPPDFPNQKGYRYCLIEIKNEQGQLKRVLREFNSFTRQIKYQELYADPLSLEEEVNQMFNQPQPPAPTVWPEPQDIKPFKKGG